MYAYLFKIKLVSLYSYPCVDLVQLDLHKQLPALPVQKRCHIQLHKEIEAWITIIWMADNLHILLSRLQWMFFTLNFLDSIYLNMCEEIGEAMENDF